MPALPTLNLTNTRVCVVGGTGGLGRAISLFMASRGAQVTVVGQTFRDADVKGIEFIKADLSLMSEAKRVAKLIPAEKLDMCIFTTGIFAASQRQVTAEGLEKDMAVSFLSRLVILREVGTRFGANTTNQEHQQQPMIRKPRVFVMGFPGNDQTGTQLDDLNCEKSYSAMACHMNTVAGNEILVLDGKNRYPKANFYGLNPGLIKTNIRDNFLGGGSLTSRVVEWFIGKLSPSPEAYAERLVPVLWSAQLEDCNGSMLNQKGQLMKTSKGLTEERVKAFLDASEALAARPFDN